MLPPPGFDWDPEMSDRCHETYGFGFLEVVYVFEDEEHDYLRIGPIDRDGEQRYLAIGRMATGLVVAVVYTMRVGVRRIIWVRPARRNERDAFNEANGE